MKIAILTDSNAGLTKEVAKEMGVFLLKNPVIIDRQVYFQEDDLSEEFFFKALEDKRDVSTSQPSPGLTMNKWDEIFKLGYDQIVFVPISRGLSSTCDTCLALAQQEEYEGKVFVVDNHRVSVTQILSIRKIQELIKEGKTGAEIKKILEDEAYESIIYLSVNTLEYLKRTGRVNAVSAAIGSLLNLKPVLTVKGEKFDAISKTRGMVKAKLEMFKFLKNDIETRFTQLKDHLVIGVAGAGLTKEEADKWTNDVKEYFSQYYSNVEVFFAPLSLSVSAHTGPKALGFGISI